jgi:hypothetical protein
MNFENFKNFHIKMRKRRWKDFGPFGGVATKVYYFFPTNFFLYPKMFFSHMAQKVWAKEIVISRCIHIGTIWCEEC